MLIRLNKYLSQSGVTSRRDADRLIEKGDVRVNGEVVRTLGTKIDESKDRVEVKGKAVKPEDDSVSIVLYKPPGYLVTLKDPQQRPTVMGLIRSLKRRVFPVGRLDFDSEGLLLFTDDGELAHRLMHPRYQIQKEYRVEVTGFPEKEALDRLKTGIVLDGKKTAPAEVRLLRQEDRHSFLQIVIHEGRKREVRRMMEAVGHDVLSLKRTRFGSIRLGNLKPGEWRRLEPHEIASLKKSVTMD
ncbi:MAG: rRNA pseudouridine synthase [Acidobacteria bacterium]|nr:rRNA pseudouridine synthase [Acidobacteriota bacterium]MBU1339389.1 rRNA pseudouridine synthase [Acidobacteriota bacterium]MBU1475535.1 rRNA pseudouridine synthase [Acidobacteriota bacterium]MBU2438929.1 rRNA pseudouridine synthase [Acidobacteriota bacterium]